MSFTREEIEEIASWVNSPTFEKVIELIEENYVDTWMMEAASVEDRERCWHMIKGLHQVAADLRGIVDDEKVEQFNRTRSRANDWRMPKPEERM